MEQKRALIIGGTALIGCYLAADLLKLGHRVTVLSQSTRFAAPEALDEEAMKEIELVFGDTTDSELLTGLLEKADIVFNKPLNQGLSGTLENARSFIENKVSSATTMHEALSQAKKKPDLLVLGSSISVYGEGAYSCLSCGTVRPSLRYKKPKDANNWNPTCPICDKALEGPLFSGENVERNGQSIYAVAKKAEEDLFSYACQINEVPLAILRYSTILGVGLSWHNLFTHFLDQLMAGENPSLHEDGQQTRDYIFVQDVVKANALVLNNYRPGSNFYNVVSERPTTILSVLKELAEIFAKKTGQPYALRPTIDGRFSPGDVRHCHSSAKRIKDELGFSCSVEQKQGFDQIVSWYFGKKNMTKLSVRGS